MDFAITINNQNGTGQMTFDQATLLMNNIYVSIMTRRGSFFQNTAFGSRLHLLQRAKNTNRTAQLAIDYSKEALSWLIDEGKAQAVDVYAERDVQQNIHQLKLLIEVTPAGGGEPVAFTTFIEVV